MAPVCAQLPYINKKGQVIIDKIPWLPSKEAIQREREFKRYIEAIRLVYAAIQPPKKKKK
jgi:hypothetical protein